MNTHGLQAAGGKSQVKKKRLWLLLACHLTLVICNCFAAGAGTTAGEFLKIGVGARALGLGETQAALADDAFAAYWNPAGLAGLSAPQLCLANNRSFQDVNQQYGALAFPFRGAGTFAASFNRLGVEDFPGFDAQGTPAASLDSGATALGLSWGKNLIPGDAPGSGALLGLTLKSLQEEHANVKGRSLAMDAGFQLRPWSRWAWLRRASLGAAVQNLGQGVAFDKETAPLPSRLNAGLGYSHFLSGDLLTLGADWHLPFGEKSFMSAGAEYWLRGVFALRAGYRTAGEGEAGFRAGAGFLLKRIQLDYAWAGFADDLKAAHHVSLSLRFGPASAPPGLADDLFRYHAEQGKKYMELEMHDRAVLEFNQALKIKPRDPETLRRLLDCGERIQEP